MSTKIENEIEALQQKRQNLAMDVFKKLRPGDYLKYEDSCVFRITKINRRNEWYDLEGSGIEIRKDNVWRYKTSMSERPLQVLMYWRVITPQKAKEFFEKACKLMRGWLYENV